MKYFLFSLTFCLTFCLSNVYAQGTQECSTDIVAKVAEVVKEKPSEKAEKAFTAWMKELEYNRRLVRLGLMEQADIDRDWDNMPESEKIGKKLIHGKFSKYANVPYAPFTDPHWTAEMFDNPDCKGKKPCFPEGHQMVKDGKAQACSCNRTCTDGPKVGCGTYCCESKCGCPGLCP